MQLSSLSFYPLTPVWVIRRQIIKLYMIDIAYYMREYSDSITIIHEHDPLRHERVLIEALICSHIAIHVEREQHNAYTITICTMIHCTASHGVKRTQRLHSKQRRPLQPHTFRHAIHSATYLSLRRFARGRQVNSDISAAAQPNERAQQATDVCQTVHNYGHDLPPPPQNCRRTARYMYTGLEVSSVNKTYCLSMLFPSLFESHYLLRLREILNILDFVRL